jgi:hypothetical protein
VKKKVSVTIAVFMLLTLGVLLSACGSDSSNGGESALAGRWRFNICGTVIELFNDGTGIDVVHGEEVEFTWVAENGRLTFTYSGGAGEPVDYAISADGSTLTLFHIHFQNEVLTRLGSN